MRPMLSRFMLCRALGVALLASACGSPAKSVLGPSDGPAPERAPAVQPASPASGGGVSIFSDKGEVEFKGKVESVTPPTLKVFGITVQTDAKTEINRGRRRIDLAELQVGETIDVEGVLLPDGTVLAEEIQVSDEGVEFTGKVESVGSSQLEVSGVTVVVDASTSIHRDERHIPLSEVRVGERVEVEGVLQADGTVLAREIEVDDGEVEFKGKVESVSPPRLRVAGVTVLTDANTRIERDDHTIALTELQVGETVEVEGMLLPDGTVLAKSIESSDDRVDFKGRVTVVDATHVRVGQVVVVIDTRTVVRVDCNRAAATEIQSNQMVHVSGTLQADGTVLAVEINVSVSVTVDVNCRQGDEDDADDDDDDDGDHDDDDEGDHDDDDDD